MTEIMLKVENLVKHFGGLVATDSLNIEVEQGEIHAVIGPNGAGKTTLIHQLSGMLESDSGTIHFDGQEISHMSSANRCHAGMVRSYQITSIFKDFSVLDNVAMSIQAREGHSFRFWKNANKDAVLAGKAREILVEMGLEERAEVLADNLAHGEQRQLEIAMALATDPKMLLLDEPMAGMGPEESSRVTKYLESMKGKYTMLLIEHDMDAVFALADRITVLVYGQAVACGTPEEIRGNEEVRHAYLGDD
ncbi:MAG: ABC transporter ATP-binding protein [Rhodospirillaceae bacterium]|jgi:branched-chain amino acid transport system ATP-binding protein|nr:ABC transporter ATP-binding protein [Rhodospirillaceae bacterium]MBT4587946.1 ABC transporter ATP-binding protein [Rhodospirillaceae bacterium]MBT4938642.1 ABC transporter ATP-binding protein [Rhodospirillaceae bacterium]MBT5941246.1 ABC transporter ATP-binding protein [Rhodospirillaceae bacterium]MBT7265879.1 ABC transporter ATP-binding protein [Rhodospirillaceae bacterium]